MLTHLTICDYTLIDRLELEFGAGLTVITGETGAGKSVLLEALGLVLGGRGDSRAVRTDATRTDITAVFSISGNLEAKQWLENRQLDCDDECFMRRVISSEGRSRGWINGQPQPLQELRSLGTLLVDLHGQHEHQSLLQRRTHGRLLDGFGSHLELAQKVADTQGQWRALKSQQEALQADAEQASQRRELLEFQIDELNKLSPLTGELEQLNEEQQRLANADEIRSTLDQVLNQIAEDEDGGLLSALSQCISLVQKLPATNAELLEILELLQSSIIQLEEATGSLRNERERSELNPERLEEIENRLSAVYQLARKHRVRPEELPKHGDGLQSELDQLTARELQSAELDQAVESIHKEYIELAEELSSHRKSAAPSLLEHVGKHLARLDMRHCQFTVQMSPNAHDLPSPHGYERVEFLISTLPDRDPEPLSRIASGGELSRISLAIQVATAATVSLPTLVFDEVDVGIGGATADVVGKMLQELGSSSQVLCVTHLAQVAVSGDAHLRVAKLESEHGVNARLDHLDLDARITEIARMLGGHKITDNSLAHAREMLAAD